MNIDRLKQVIQTANPECLKETYDFRIQPEELSDKSYTEPLLKFIREHHYKEIRPIRLADVLLAIEKVPLPKHLLVLPSGNIYLFESGVLDTPVTSWNLKDDNLDNQSDETKQFLIDLLSPQPPKAVVT